MKNEEFATAILSADGAAVANFSFFIYLHSSFTFILHLPSFFISQRQCLYVGFDHSLSLSSEDPAYGVLQLFVVYA